MSSKLRVFVSAALCAALGVGTAFANVTINGKALSQIDDIIVETGGSRTVNQESLLKVYKNAGSDKFRIIAVKGDTSGSLSQTTNTMELSATGERTNTGAHPAVGTKRNDDGSFLLLVPSASDHGVKASLYRIGLDENCNITQTQLGITWSVDGGDVYVSDAVGGLSGINGREVFVIAYFTSD